MKSITILGLKIKIKYIKNLTSPTTGRLMDGYYDCHNDEILIRNELNDKQRMLTLYHEIGEALMIRTGMRLTTPDEIIHPVIEQYAQLMFDLFGFID